MKKPDQQVLNDTPPFSCDLPLEPAPLAVPLLSPQKPPEEERSTKRQQKNSKSRPVFPRTPTRLLNLLAENAADPSSIPHTTKPLPPLTIRERVTAAVPWFWSCYQLRDLTVQQFQGHFFERLQNFPLSDRSRQELLADLNKQRVPADQQFWDALQLAAEEGKLFTLRSLIEVAQFVDGHLKKRFERKGTPETWMQAAVYVVLNLFHIRDAARQDIHAASEQWRQQWSAGNPEGLVSAVREGLLTETWVSQVIVDLQRQRVMGTTEEEQDQAAEKLERIAKAITEIGPGKRKMSQKEREQIIADCKKWRPICEGLNKAFKGLWKQSEYESSELYRKEARGLLAEKYGISVKEVKTIERVLKTPSRRSNKSTPTEAMFQMVALDHVNRDVKTIEKTWGDYLDEYPEERRKRRRSTT